METSGFIAQKANGKFLKRKSKFTLADTRKAEKRGGFRLWRVLYSLFDRVPVYG